MSTAGSNLQQNAVSTFKDVIWRRWWTRILFLLLLAFLLFLVLAWHPGISPIEPPAQSAFAAESIERGGILAAAGNCASCHSVAGETNYAGGRAFPTPFGTLYSSNITPDPDAGIGDWSQEAFDRAMRKGISRNGAHLFPAFPFTQFKNVTDEDLADLYAYFMTREASDAEEPNNNLIFPFNFRVFQAGWKLLFFNSKPLSTETDKSDQWNRGAYLAEGLAHCSACHTPRNMLGAEKSGRKKYAGALVSDWYAPSLNANADAPLNWSEDELFAFLRSGGSPLHGVAGGTMSGVIHDGLAALPDEDIRALSIYFADLGAANGPIETNDIVAVMTGANVDELSDAAQRGSVLYADACAACHYNVAGAPKTARPEMALNSAVTGPDPSNLIRFILGGVGVHDALPEAYMQPYHDALSDRDIADIATYLNESYAPAQHHWKSGARLEARVRALREENGKNDGH